MLLSLLVRPLNDQHPDGGPKSAFLKGFGFNDRNWRVLRDALYAYALRARVLRQIDSEYGTKYEVAGVLQSPDGHNPEVMTVWIVEAGKSSPRLVTLHPSKRRISRDEQHRTPGT